ncbi:MAG: methyltransferase, partial [Anaerolineae bacterium]|nr:methyltransferase [Anaerolineae bacterium]
PHIMDPEEMKRQFGDKLCFYGGIDVEQTLPSGTPDEVRREIRNRAEVMGKGGGYILQSSHTILEDTPVENLMAYIDEVRAMAGMA